MNEHCAKKERWTKPAPVALTTKLTVSTQLLPPFQEARLKAEGSLVQEPFGSSAGWSFYGKQFLTHTRRSKLSTACFGAGFYAINSMNKSEISANAGDEPTATDPLYLSGPRDFNRIPGRSQTRLAKAA